MAKTRGTSSKGRSAADTARNNPMAQGRPPSGGNGTGSFNLADASKNFGGALQQIGGKAADLLNNPTLARLGINKLVPGGFGKVGASLPNVNFGSFQTGGAVTADNDWKVRVTAAPAGPFDFSEGPLNALSGDGGVVFPYTPNVSVTHSAMYGAQQPAHTNYPSYFYQNSTVQAISLSGEFTAQNEDDALYVLGAIWFFRAATKMFYGGPQAGNPPPIVYLDGYGDYYLPHVTCVVTNFTHTMPSGIDYINCAVQPVTISNTTVQGNSFEAQAQQAGLSSNSVIGLAGAAQAQGATTTQTGESAQSPKQVVDTVVGGGAARIPTKSTIQITLQPVYSRRNISGKFTWEDFSKGMLLKGNGGFL